MGAIWDSLLTGQGLMLLITFIIFIATVILILRGLIGFIVTGLMLFIAVVTGAMIYHNGIVQELFHYDTNVLPENKKITMTSIRENVLEVYELFRRGICTDTVKVVYDSRTIDTLDNSISRLQDQQEHLQRVINNLRASLPKESAEHSESDLSEKGHK
jgi:hypothetical protein